MKKLINYISIFFICFAQVTLTSELRQFQFLYSVVQDTPLQSESTALKPLLSLRLKTNEFAILAKRAHDTLSAFCQGGVDEFAVHNIQASVMRQAFDRCGNPQQEVSQEHIFDLCNLLQAITDSKKLIVTQIPCTEVSLTAGNPLSETRTQELASKILERVERCTTAAEADFTSSDALMQHPAIAELKDLEAHHSINQLYRALTYYQLTTNAQVPGCHLVKKTIDKWEHLTNQVLPASLLLKLSRLSGQSKPSCLQLHLLAYELSAALKHTQHKLHIPIQVPTTNSMENLLRHLHVQLPTHAVFSMQSQAHKRDLDRAYNLMPEHALFIPEITHHHQKIIYTLRDIEALFQRNPAQTLQVELASILEKTYTSMVHDMTTMFTRESFQDALKASDQALWPTAAKSLHQYSTIANSMFVQWLSSIVHHCTQDNIYVMQFPTQQLYSLTAELHVRQCRATTIPLPSADAWALVLGSEGVAIQHDFERLHQLLSSCAPTMNNLSRPDYVASAEDSYLQRRWYKEYVLDNQDMQQLADRLEQTLKTTLIPLTMFTPDEEIIQHPAAITQAVIQLIASYRQATAWYYHLITSYGVFAPPTPSSSSDDISELSSAEDTDDDGDLDTAV